MHVSNDYIKKLHKDRGEIVDFCSQFERIYLYGAGGISKRVLAYLWEEGIEAAGVLVTKKESGQEKFCGLLVEEVGNHAFRAGDGIILAVGRKFWEEILAELEGRIDRRNIYLPLLYCMHAGLSFRNEPPRTAQLSTGRAGTGYFAGYRELEEIGRACGTDKSGECHDYLQKYEYILRPYKDRKFTMLELGVFKGASLEMWSRYFPKADIVGVDIDEKCRCFAGGGKRVLIMDASLEDNLLKLKEHKPSIIVDDASHIWSHQIKALFILFDSLPSGGIFILEDLGTSFPSYRHQYFNDSVVSTYEICSAIAEAFTGGEGLDIAKIPARIALFKNEIEALSREIDMIAMIEESWIFIKK